MAFGWPQSVPVASGLRLPDLVPRSRLHVGLILALVVAALVWLLQARTVFGADAGGGAEPTRRRLCRGAADRDLGQGGRVVGWAGGPCRCGRGVLGPTGDATTTMSPGFGYAGIVVAMLAALHPMGVVAAAIFVATVFVGATR